MKVIKIDMKNTIQLIKKNLDTAEITVNSSEPDFNSISKEFDDRHRNAKVICVIKCKKSLFKSTYGKNAFTKNKKYDLVENPHIDCVKPENINDDIVYVRDSSGRAFSFSKTGHRRMYVLGDYFNLALLRRKIIKDVLK
jgi:hypothetical protein